MNPFLRRFAFYGCVVVLCLAWLPLWGQSKASSRSGTSSEGELVNPGDNPAVRYPVAHFSGSGLFASFDYGWLSFSRDTIRYEVVRGDKGHSFEYRRSELELAKEWTTFGLPNRAAELRFHGTNYHFWQVARSNLESGRAHSTGYQELISTANNPEDALAMGEARYARFAPPKPAAPTAPPPTISMLEPAGAEEGRTVPAYDPTLHVRGIASQASGIASVSVNGQSAFFKPLAPQTVEFDLRDLPLSAGMSAVVVVATATDKSVSQMTFKVGRPEVRVLEPGAGSEVRDAAVKVRGLAVGFQDVDKVEVAGQSATLRRRDDGSVEFEAASVPLALGPNALQGYVLTRGGVRQNFRLDLKRLPPPGPPPLTLAEVEKALSDLPRKRVVEMVGEYGVDFELSSQAEKRLRDAGADSDLLLAIAKAKK
ncbi:MAG TPA: hypothetical protein VGQ94_00835 [Terriglobales bacterium]|nr:hypothetical protein [Terriglobales bacterium]